MPSRLLQRHVVVLIARIRIHTGAASRAGFPNWEVKKCFEASPTAKSEPSLTSFLASQMSTGHSYSGFFDVKPFPALARAAHRRSRSSGSYQNSRHPLLLQPRCLPTINPGLRQGAVSACSLSRARSMAVAPSARASFKSAPADCRNSSALVCPKLAATSTGVRPRERSPCGDNCSAGAVVASARAEYNTVCGLASPLRF